jgi:hypothetical protein
MSDSVVKELRVVAVEMAEKLCSGFVIGFFTNGSVYFDIIEEDGVQPVENIDDEIQALRLAKKDLINMLSLWYVIYKTSYGNKLKEKYINKHGGAKK